ncbi:MAG: Rne/Rng family ribonuclease, partial [Pseudomonadota bacterium]
MVLRILIDAVHSDETRVVIADNARIDDFDFVTAAKKQVKGNVYLAKITRVEPSLQAAFVEYGNGKQGFLPFAEIHPDYYQIPIADRQRLLEEENGHFGDDSGDLPVAEASEVAPSVPVGETLQDHMNIIELASGDEIIASEVQEIVAEYELEVAPVVAAVEEPAAIELVASEPQELPAAEENIVVNEAIVAHEDVVAPVVYSEPVVESVIESGVESELALEATYQNNEDNSSDNNGDNNNDSGEIETLSSDEDAVMQSRRTSFSRRYKIQEVIKRNQIVLVQVIKEERGNKGVSLTTYISLAGRYCVLMPNSPKAGGISRKISSGEDRRRLKEISADLKLTGGMGAIIRTAGIDRTKIEIQKDYEYLIKLWEGIREQTLSSSAPALIYEEGDIIKRTIRDLYHNDIEEVIVEGEEAFHQAKNFLKMIMPSHAPRVKLHKDKVPLFYAYNIEDSLNSMYEPNVKLKSGGYLVLNPTEALISIDVNSGRSTGERNIEETAFKTNMEAANEVARQLRLRDLAGLIVIDFIDMMDSRNRRTVEKTLKEALRQDRAKIQVGHISPFGLLEMSRQRLRPSISEATTTPCRHCQGRGVVRSDYSVSLQLVRSIEKEIAGGYVGEVKVFVNASIALALLNSRRDVLTAMEQKYDCRINVLIDDLLAQGNFRIEKIKSQRRPNNPNQNRNADPVTIDQVAMEETGLEVVEGVEAGESVVGEEGANRPPRPRRNRRNGRNRKPRDGESFEPRENVGGGEEVASVS